MTTDPHASAELTDDALQGEIELVGDLVVAASSSEGPLSDDEIDAALGLAPCEGQDAADSDAHDDAAGQRPAGEAADADDAAGSGGGGRAPGASRRQHD